MDINDFVHLKRENWAEWFTLDFVQGPDPTTLPLSVPPIPLLVLSIAEEPLRRFLDNLSKTGALAHYRKHLLEYEISSDFRLDPGQPLGYRGVLTPRQSSCAGMLEYVIPIPQVEHDAGPCESCAGTGKTEEGFNCIHCFETGRETSHDWTLVDCISATLWVLQPLLDSPGKDLLAGTPSGRQQLLSLQTCFQRGYAGIAAVLSQPFGDYLRRLSNQELPLAKAAIKESYWRMFPGYKRFSEFSFKARVHENGQLLLDTSGNACGLYVDGMSRSLREDSGPMELSCHNVDSHAQQLSLLCGLAAVCGMARQRK